MIEVGEALEILASEPITCERKLLPISEAVGQILAQDIIADRDFPAYDRVTMDGIAISFAGFSGGRRVFDIEEIIAAGSPRYKLQDANKAVEIMTGAVLPEGCDTVIRYEDIAKDGGKATILEANIKVGQNVHKQGTDRKAGSVIVHAPVQIGSAEAGIAATVGQSMVEVYHVPEVVLISTGNELVSIDEHPLAHQIRSSNNYALSASLKRWPLEVKYLHLPDDEDILTKRIQELVEKHRILVFMGGSSAGKFDFIPSTLRKLGVKEHFYKIAQRPGKPMWFGTNKDTFVFALPGNPVSCFLCLERYFKFWLNKSLGLPKNKVSKARLAADVSFKPDLTYYLQVELSQEGAELVAVPVAGSGSGDHANLADVSAFLALPRGRSKFGKGEVFEVFPFRPLSSL